MNIKLNRTNKSNVFYTLYYLINNCGTLYFTDKSSGSSVDESDNFPLSINEMQAINPFSPLLSLSVLGNFPFDSAPHNEENKETVKYNWHDKKILIVEDDDANYLFLEYALRRTNVKIIRAIDGLQAVKLAKQFADINIILMDIQLPLMDGYDATSQIRSYNKHIPIFAQTAYAQQTDKNKCFECGCNEFLTKPINKDELLELINKYFNELI